jgi:hypothetical protein
LFVSGSADALADLLKPFRSGTAFCFLAVAAAERC